MIYIYIYSIDDIKKVMQGANVIISDPIMPESSYCLPVPELYV